MSKLQKTFKLIDLEIKREELVNERDLLWDNDRLVQAFALVREINKLDEQIKELAND